MITTCLVFGLGLLTCLWVGGLISYVFNLGPKATGNVVVWLFSLLVIGCLLSLA